MTDELRFGRPSTGVGGAGLTPAQVAKLAKSAKYQGEFNPATNMLAGEYVSFNGGLFKALMAIASGGANPIDAPSVWQSVSNAIVSVDSVPPQGTAHVNNPLYIYDSTSKKLFKLNRLAPNPIYEELQLGVSVSTTGGGSGPYTASLGVKAVGNNFQIDVSGLDPLPN